MNVLILMPIYECVDTDALLWMCQYWCPPMNVSILMMPTYECVHTDAYLWMCRYWCPPMNFSILMPTNEWVDIDSTYECVDTDAHLWMCRYWWCPPMNVRKEWVSIWVHPSGTPHTTGYPRLAGPASRRKLAGKWGFRGNAHFQKFPVFFIWLIYFKGTLPPDKKIF